jgi:hypothetical protein
MAGFETARSSASVADIRKLGLAALVFAVAIWAGAAVPFQVLQMPLIATLLAAAGLAVAALQLRNGIPGLTILIASAVAFPMEFGGGGRKPLNAALPLAAGIVALWLLGVFVFRRRTGLVPSRVVYAVGIFMALGVASFVAGQFPKDGIAGAPLGAQLAGLALVLVSGGLLLTVGSLVRQLQELQFLTWVFVGAGSITCITQSFSGLDIVGRWVVGGSVGSLFWVWLVAVSLSQSACNRDLKLLTRLFLFSIAAIALYRGLFLARSWVSGWVPLLVTVGIVAFFRSPRVAFSLSLLIPPAILLWGGRFIQSVSDTEQYSSMTRLEAWKVLWPLIEKSPLVGLGPSHYYYYTENLPILGWYVKFCSHNQYVDLVAQYGFLGLAAFCWLVLEITSTTLWLRPRVRTYFANSYLIGAVAGIGGTIVSGMLADWIIPFYYNIGIGGFRSSLLFWFFLGGVLTLRRMTLDELEREAEESDQICASCS